MDPDRLIHIAGHLAGGGAGPRRGRPNQTDLRRAVSAAYYALFHTLAATCSDQLAGPGRSSSVQAAWRQTYRALEHGHARNQITRKSALQRFPPDIVDFADHFKVMQDLRQAADYDPDASFDRRQVAQLVEETQRRSRRFKAAPRAEQRAFGLYVLLRSRAD